MSKPSFTPEFKREAANLVLQQGYSVPEASQAVGVSQSALRRWVKQLKEEQLGFTPEGSKALTAEQQRIQDLEKRLKRMERENEILKKAAALLAADKINSLG